MTRHAQAYQRIARKLSHIELVRSSMDDDLGAEQLDLMRRHGHERFLDYYGDEGLLTAFERYGYLDALRSRGFHDFELETRADDDRHTLILLSRPADGGPPERLVDLVVRRDLMVPERLPGLPALPGPFRVLTVDWLGLRNPRGRFSHERPRLPGQDAPGLGVGERTIELLYRAVDRLKLDALLCVGAHFHNSLLYVRELPYFDPAFDGQLRSLHHLLMEEHGLSLAQASWAVDWGCVRRADGDVFDWRGQAQLWPRASALREHLGSEAYRRTARTAAVQLRFALDVERFEGRWSEERAGLEGAQAAPQ